MAIAKEWADELSKFKGHELLVSEETMWGFSEVTRGRHPDVVLKEVIAKIAERMPQSTSISNGYRSPGHIRPPEQR